MGINKSSMGVHGQMSNRGTKSKSPMARVFLNTNQKLYGIRNSIENARSISPINPFKIIDDENSQILQGDDDIGKRQSFMELANKSTILDGSQESLHVDDGASIGEKSKILNPNTTVAHLTT